MTTLTEEELKGFDRESLVKLAIHLSESLTKGYLQLKAGRQDHYATLFAAAIADGDLAIALTVLRAMEEGRLR